MSISDVIGTFTLVDPQSDDWYKIDSTIAIWHKKYYSRLFKDEEGKDKVMPYYEGELLRWYCKEKNYNIVSHIAMFENNNRLSTQVPMRHTYYTENKELLALNVAFRLTTIKYSEECYEMERYQEIIKGLLKEKHK